MFMFDDVPEPVWNTSTGNWSSHDAVGDLGGRGGDGGADLLGDRGDVLQRRVHRRGLALDERQRPDQAGLEREPGDREVLDGPLGLRAPLRVRRYRDVAHRVVLDPGGGDRRQPRGDCGLVGGRVAGHADRTGASRSRRMRLRAAAVATVGQRAVQPPSTVRMWPVT